MLVDLWRIEGSGKQEQAAGGSAGGRYEASTDDLLASVQTGLVHHGSHQMTSKMVRIEFFSDKFSFANHFVGKPIKEC